MAMTKEQKTWSILILGGIAVVVTLVLIVKFWWTVVVGGVGILGGYYFGYRHGKSKRDENQESS